MSVQHGCDGAGATSPNPSMHRSLAPSLLRRGQVGMDLSHSIHLGAPSVAAVSQSLQGFAEG